MSNIQNIHNNINKFVRKFYLFKALRGVIFSVGLFGFLYLSAVLFNYFFYFTPLTKTIIFYSFLVVVVFAFVEFVVVPLLRMNKILPQIDDFRASQSISSKIPEVKDLLINVLELDLENADNNLLVNASIMQKTQKLSVFNFSNAVDYRELKKYVKYLVLPLALFVFIAIFNFSIIEKGSDRFVNYSVYYEEELPFQFNLLNDNLTTQTGKDIEIKLQIVGDYVPANIFVTYGTNRVPLVFDRQSGGYSYVFRSVTSKFDFYFDADGYKSENYTINVLPSPIITDFSISVNPPSYVGMKPFVVKNSGDIIAPYGSKLKFSFKTNNVDSLFLLMDTLLATNKVDGSSFIYDYSLKKSVFYKVLVSNSYFSDYLLKYNLTVVPDLYPSISVMATTDSNDVNLFYFRGEIADDYGYHKLSFHYSIIDNATNKVLDSKQIFIPIPSKLLKQDFYYYFNFNDLNLTSKQKVKYYFKVSDNDYLSGYKSVMSNVGVFSLLSLQQADSAFSDLNKKVTEELDKAYELSVEIQKNINDFKKRTLNEDVSSWEKENFLENLLQKQKSLETMLDSLNENNQKKLNQLKAHEKENEELLKKHEEIQKLIDELFTDELKELLKELEKLRENFDDKKFDQQLEKTEVNYEDMSSELDRTKELLKRMQVEQQMENLTNQLNELAEEQKQLAESFKEKNISADKKDSLMTNSFKFDELMSKYDSLQKFNKDLEKPYELEDFNDLKEEIEQNFDDAKQQMQKNKNKKSSQEMNKAAENMQKMSEQMQAMMQNNMMMQNGEDMEAIKFMLSNLLNFSFSQEELALETEKRYALLSEQYHKIKVKQAVLTNQFKIVADSLNALASRNSAVSKVVTDEVKNINYNLSQSNSLLDKNRRSSSVLAQRRVLSSANKLALMLKESLNNMQKQGQGSSSTTGKPKPGSDPMPGMQQMKQMQQSMQKQLQQMIQDMKNGKNPGSRSRAEQIARREAFQKMLQDLMNSEQMGDEMKQLLQEINQLNDNIKKDVLNNNISNELLNRQKEIQTRLLEVESADNKRKFSKKRESKSGSNITRTKPEEIEKYFEKYKLQNESFSKKIIKLNPFYKNIYNDYVYRLGQK